METNEQTLTPAAIDAAIIQLQTMIDVMPLPEKVKNSGKQFVSDLEEWNEAMKNGHK